MRHTVAALCAAVALAAGGCRSNEPLLARRTPEAAVARAAEQFRRAISSALDDAGERTGMGFSSQGFAAVSAGTSATLIVVAPIEGAERMTIPRLARGADLFLVFLPPTAETDLRPGPYVVRTLRDTSGRWKARLVDLDDEAAGETGLSVREHELVPARTCRPSIDRSAKRVTAAIDCGSYSASLSLPEDLGSATKAYASPVGRRVVAANDDLRRSIRSAVCAESRSWDISRCPSTFIVGSRSDSFVVSAALGGSEPVPLDELRRGFDSLFTFLDLPGAFDVPRGFAVIRRSERRDGSLIAEIRRKNGEVIANVVPTSERTPVGSSVTERYVSYLDSSIVCVDHDYPVTDVNTGETWTETDITCFSGRVATATTPPPADEDEARPTLTPEPSPTQITATPSPTPETTTPPPTESPVPSATTEPSPTANA